MDHCSFRMHRKKKSRNKNENYIDNSVNNNYNQNEEKCLKNEIENNDLKKFEYNPQIFLESICDRESDINKYYLTGPTGPRGLRGLKGDKGEIGMRGPRGIRGERGPTSFSDIFYDNENGTIAINREKNKENQNLGKSNIFIGVKSGYENKSNENVYIGYNSGVVESKGSNTFIGCEAGKYSSGTRNTFIGDSVCSFTGSNGSYNVFIGAETAYKNISGSSNVFLGNIAGAYNKDGSSNIFIGQSAGHTNECGADNIFIGTESGMSNIQGNNNICIGHSSDTTDDNPFNQIVFGQGVTSYGDNSITFPKNLKSMSSGTEVNFSNSGGGCLFPVSSSIRWKENIKDISETIDTSLIYNLRPVTYNPIIGHGDPNEVHIGLIAEEVDELFPIIVPKDDKNQPASVRYSMLGVLLIAEIKKIKKEIEELKNNII